MYRFLLRPRWIVFHLVVVAAIVAMVNFGFWQLRRLDDRQEFNALVEARYLPDDGLLVVNRSQNGRAVVNTVVPLRLDDGRILLVNRGFVPLAVDTPPVPATDVEVTGRLRPSQERRLGQLSDPGEGVLREAQRLDLERLDTQFDGLLVPMYVDLMRSSPPEGDGIPEPVIAPDLSEGNHLSYAAQWFIFSIAAAVGWVLAVRRSARTRQHATTTEQATRDEQPTDVDEPVSVGAATDDR